MRLYRNSYYFFVMIYNPLFMILLFEDKTFPADLVTFTEEILNEKLNFLCSVKNNMLVRNSFLIIFFLNVLFVTDRFNI